MKRRLFNVGAAVSLALCVAVCALWVRSYWCYDWFGLGWPPLGMASHRGGCLIQLGMDPMDSRGWETDPRMANRNSLAYEIRWFGYHDYGDGRVGVGCPHVVPALILAAVPALLLLGRRLRSRRFPSGCPACGYDLRGTPGSKCPECGAERECEAR